MKKPKHYLITVDIIPLKVRMHGYLVTDDRRYVDNAMNKMADQAELISKELGGPFFPAFLITTLSTGVKTVQAIISTHNSEAAENIRTMKNMHFSSWVWAVDNNPDDARLMELH